MLLAFLYHGKESVIASSGIVAFMILSAVCVVLYELNNKRKNKK